MSHLLIETMCLPPIPVMHAIVRHSEVILEAHEHYQKRSFRNRVYTVGPQGVEHFSIPLQKGKNQQQNIRDCTISYSENWPLKFSRQIRTNYGSAPYFAYYIDELEEIIFNKWDRIWDLNLALIHWIQRCLQVTFTLSSTEQYETNVSNTISDYRGAFKPDKAFLNRPALIHYEQVFSDKHGYVANLSVLDLIMCCGPESSAILTG